MKVDFLSNNVGCRNRKEKELDIFAVLCRRYKQFTKHLVHLGSIHLEVVLWTSLSVGGRAAVDHLGDICRLSFMVTVIREMGF